MLTLHNPPQFVTSFVLVQMKSSVHPMFLSDLNEDSDVLQWPIGRKIVQKDINNTENAKAVIIRISCA